MATSSIPESYTTGEVSHGILAALNSRSRVLLKSYSNVHHSNGLPNVFLFSVPRSGSTWLMELIWSQPGFKSCDEPTELRDPRCRDALGIESWEELYSSSANTRLEAYFKGFCDGQLRFLNPSPRRQHYRMYTSRIVFKILTGHEHRIQWFRDTFGGRIVYLFRHPIAVSLSRESLPTLETLIAGEYRGHFTPQQLKLAERVNASGSELERGVLCWCLQSAVPLREMSADWAVVSYEQLVVEPRPAIQYLADKLELPRPDLMLQQLGVPSNVKRKSDPTTQRLLEAGRPEDRLHLIEKWRTRVSEDEERRLMDLLPQFDIDVYRAGEILPSDRIWI